MHWHRSSLARLGVLAATIAIVAAACGGATPTAAPSEAAVAVRERRRDAVAHAARHP